MVPSTKFTEGQAVQYAKPEDESEAKIRFRVLEDHRDAEPARVMIQMTHDDQGSELNWRILPVEVVAPDELKAVPD